MRIVCSFPAVVALLALMSSVSAVEIGVEVHGASRRPGINWDERARKQDPVGFVTHVRTQLTSDLAMLRKSQKALETELTGLVSELHNQRARLAKAGQQAGRLRRHYQQAQKCGTFPVTICGTSYTEDQLRCKIRLCLAELKGYKDRIKRLQDARYRAEVTVEQLAVRVKDTQACITVLATEIELLKYHELPSRGEELLASVASVVTENDCVRQRPFDLLYGECKPKVEPMITERELRGYLQTKLTRNKTKHRLDFSDVRDLRSKPSAKPIFQQN